ncbi:hypothetical protein OAK66_03905 [Candidatus Nitrosopelagicus sp.]|nr:hypothetical protein [Candidatus Nitrosopelagicus sp.]
MHKITFLIILLIGISFIPVSFSEGIPQWVKNNAEWWAERQISQTEFTNGLEFLINEGIIYIPSTEPGIPGPDKIIPDWVRNTAGWWSDNKIPDSEFTNAMKYLIEIGIIDVDVSSPEVIEEETSEEIIETSITGKPLLMLLEGYNHVHTDGKYVLDVLIFDAEKYPNASPTFNRNASYTLDEVNIDISLYNEEGLIHTYSGLTKNGFLRYDILARETNQDGTLWMINNLYTVNINASLDGQTIEKQIEFLGQASTYAYNQYDKKKIKYDISKSSFKGELDISGTVTTPEGLIFSPNGKKMFVPDNNDDKINQFTLATAWDISSATQSATSAATGEGGTDDIEDLAFNSDGTKMFIIERNADKILEYNLSIPYDVSDSSMTDANDDLTIANSVTNNPEDIAFNTAGNKMFILENDDQVTGDQIFEYELSTAFDVSTATLIADEHLTLTDSTNADAFEFSSNGLYLYVADPHNDDTLLQYTMSSAWDVSSASLTRTLDISAQESASRGLAFGDTDGKFYLTGTSQTVWQYNLG